MKEVLSQSSKTVSSTARQEKTSYSGTAIGSGKTRGSFAEALSYLGISLTVLFFFFRTVFLGLPISKICRMAEWDSIYSAYATGKSALCDPSIIHLLIPHYFLVAQMWKSGNLPLWNPYSACGAPLIGDIQACVFSPMRLLFTFFPSMYTYNLSMVLLVVGAAAFTFALSRKLGLSRWAAALAAMAYALCPYQLFYLELLSGPSYCLFPLTFFAFVHAAQRKTFSSFVGCGLISTLLIISGHPELSFFGIFFASLLMGGLIVSGAATRYGVIETVNKRLTAFAFGLTFAGIITFLLSAPVLLPFAEFLLNSDCYKYGVGISAYVPWQCVTYHLLQPGFGAASPYLGLVATCLWPLSLFVNGKKGLIAKCLGLVALVAFVLMSRVGPMDFVLQHPPMLWLVTVYCLPLYLLSLSVMAGIGLDKVLAGDSENKFGVNKSVAFVSVCVAAALLIPFALNICNVPLRSGDFDLILPHMYFDKINWIRDCLLGISLIAVLLIGNRLKDRYRVVVSVIVLTLAFVGLAALARTSLPIENKFNYPQVEPLAYLKAQNDRMISIGPHLLRANTNTVYGIPDLRDFNVLFPKRYLQFAKAAGAKLEMFTEVFDSSLNHLVDMASVKYVLTQLPLQTESRQSLQVIRENPSFKLYENATALPKAYIVHDYVLADSSQKALDLISDAGFDYNHKVVLESPSPQLSFVGAAGVEDKTSVKRDNVNSVTIKTGSDHGGILVLTDTYYPGWKALLDGEETEVLRANYLFRGVVVPSGEHVVKFVYQPFSFILGILLAIGAIAFLLLMVTVGKRFIREVG
ncbi:MAG: YfhO family protein [Candidatus Obscuribacterales bacterium]|nr:YfhO family protein [Candidatus Obscuribacterales bacterium]